MLIVVLAFSWWQTRDQGSNPDHGPGGGSTTVKVDRVVDGDTAKVFYDGDSEYVRYIGIDTPESVQPNAPVECFGEESKDFNAGLIEGRRMKLVFDEEKRDHYGRLLAYVYVDGKLLQAEMLRRGYATTLEVSPNTARAGQFSELESEARDAGRGLWSAC
ncbi:MAG TPA: thermonuclease family protein [Solirubrobacterales bacterium]|nr:thermonuclease family protein [Solirubrobacterales bacterium]